MCTDLCEVIITLHFVVCVVVKNALLLAYSNALFASYMESTWIAAVVLEMVLGLFSVCWAKAKYESKDSDCITYTLEFVMGLLHLIMQARIIYILHDTDLCKRAKKVENDYTWITTFILVFLDNVYRFFLLTVKCFETIDKNECYKVLWSWSLILILCISGSNIYISYYYECKVF